MPAKPAKTTVPSSTHKVQYAFFPYARYTSVVGVHTSLVAFTTLFLPQTSLLLWPSLADSDRPQSKFKDALTDNPAITLAWIVAGLVILQVWWAGWIRQWCFEYTSRGGTSDEIKMDRYRFDRGRFSRLGRAAVFTSCVALVFHATIVLFGAPSASHLPHTFLLAIVLALLSAFAPAYALGSPSFSSDASSFITRLNWTRLFAELSPRNPIERALVYPAVTTLLGAWLGTLPIALDWDRPWQAWPLTPLFGGIAGYIVGSLSALSVNALKWLTEENIRREQSEKQKTT